MIYLIRHGMDDESYIGGYSSVNLTEFGKMQVNELGNWLQLQNLNVDKIYTSDIKRAISTTNIINSYLKLPVYKVLELRELDKGELTGMKKSIAMIKYPDYMNVDDIRKRYPLGESMLDLYIRIKDLFSRISQYDDSILVTHRGVINMFYYLLLNEELDMDKEKYDVEHASVHELDIVKSKIRRIR